MRIQNINDMDFTYIKHTLTLIVIEEKVIWFASIKPLISIVVFFNILQRLVLPIAFNFLLVVNSIQAEYFWDIFNQYFYSEIYCHHLSENVNTCMGMVQKSFELENQYNLYSNLMQ